MEEDQTNYCKLRLGFIHPDIAPDEISEKLGLTPVFFQKAGEPRFTPKGTRLPGVHKDSRWILPRLCRNGRELIDEISRLLERLERNCEWVSLLLASRGIIHITLSFSGDYYIGLSIPPDLNKRLGKAGVELGIEVFPDWAPENAWYLSVEDNAA